MTAELMELPDDHTSKQHERAIRKTLDRALTAVNAVLDTPIECEAYYDTYKWLFDARKALIQAQRNLP